MLYVANNNFPYHVSIFDTAHGNAPLMPITGGGLQQPLGLALDEVRGKLYVANNDSNLGSVSVFDTAHANAPLTPITGPMSGTGVNDPVGLALDASGRLCVGNRTDSVSVIDTTTGNAPLPQIPVGVKSFFFGVSGMAIDDGSGKLYVASPNQNDNSVFVFNTNDANVFGIRRWAGPPQCLAADLERSARYRRWHLGPYAAGVEDRLATSLATATPVSSAAPRGSLLTRSWSSSAVSAVGWTSPTPWRSIERTSDRFRRRAGAHSARLRLRQPKFVAGRTMGFGQVKPNRALPDVC